MLTTLLRQPFVLSAAVGIALACAFASCSNSDTIGGIGAGAGGGSGTTGATCGNAKVVGGENVVCGTGQFCDRGCVPNVGPDSPGTCTAMPGVCDDVASYPQICGCDGKLYGNPCKAASAGVSIDASNTACQGQIGSACGGKDGLKCGSGQYCVYFPGAAPCGTDDAFGECQAIPPSCEDSTSSSSVVCGCDGKSYEGRCEAARAGTDIAGSRASLGQCTGGTGGGVTCGGFNGAVCPSSDYCDFGGGCPSHDQSGTCKPKPAGCSADCAQPELCGCDGKQYCNLCTAEAAGTGIDDTRSRCGGGTAGTAGAVGTEGAAGTVGTAGAGGGASASPCGGVAGLVCAGGYFCDFSQVNTTDPCGGGDSFGECQPMPIECSPPAGGQTVCGCDGKTYPSACVANETGVSVGPSSVCTGK